MMRPRVLPSHPWARGLLLLWMVAHPSLAAAQPSPPSLVVVIVVDQFRADYIDDYGHQWSAGLRRLLDDGAWFQNAAYPYRSTVTCPGHATISTGTFPSTHGMISNTWWDRAQRAAVSCTTDPSARPLAYGGGVPVERHSPSPLLAPTLADRLRAGGGSDSRVVSLSLKPRSAITLAGQAADAIAWFDSGNTWATSTAYGPTPSDVVTRFVNANPVAEAVGLDWTRALPPADYLHDDDAEGAHPPSGWSDRFPHRFSGTADGDFYTQWRASPRSDRYLTEIARDLVDSLQLGQGRRTDYLAIGFSALDYVGHRFGPRSHEVQDVLVQLDAALSDLLGDLDRSIGRDGYVVALSADHGVSPIPEQAVGDGVEAGRTNSDLSTELEQWLSGRQGPGPHIAALNGNDLYFRPGVYDRLRRQPDELAALVSVIKTSPGMWRVYRGDTIQDGDLSDPVTRAVRLSYYEGRSGDLILVPRPFWIGQGIAATHGSPYGYDTKVPLVLFGAGVTAGRFGAAATPADIAPTLASLVGVALPDVDGRVLSEALQD